MLPTTDRVDLCRQIAAESATKPRDEIQRLSIRDGIRAVGQVLGLSAALALTACSEPPIEDRQFAPTPPNPPPPQTQPPAPKTSPAETVSAFLAGLRPHCGRAFAGRITANEPPQENDPFDGKALIVHVRDCGETELRMPFHVGDDRSRTWVLRRVGENLQLKHDHRHADGSEDVITQYGGTSDGSGSAARLAFPIDAESRALFEREGLVASLNNVWAMEIEPDLTLVYELSRPTGRLFRVEFDLSQPVPHPPPAWGAD